MTKKAPKIYSTDTEKLSAAINEAEGRATARTMNAEYVGSKQYDNEGLTPLNMNEVQRFVDLKCNDLFDMSWIRSANHDKI